MTTNESGLTHEDRELIASLRADLAALTRDVAYLQSEVEEIHVVFSRLVWLMVVALAAALLRFALEGGLAGMQPLNVPP